MAVPNGTFVVCIASSLLRNGIAYSVWLGDSSSKTRTKHWSTYEISQHCLSWCKTYTVYFYLPFPIAHQMYFGFTQVLITLEPQLRHRMAEVMSFETKVVRRPPSQTYGRIVVLGVRRSGKFSSRKTLRVYRHRQT